METVILQQGVAEEEARGGVEEEVEEDWSVLEDLEEEEGILR